MRKRERERERKREYLFLKGMTGALAPFSNLVTNRLHLILTNSLFVQMLLC